MKILCFGDSNTWGFDPRYPLGLQYQRIWPDLLAEKLNCTVINDGQNGREIPKQTIEFPGDIDLLIIMLGTNDLLQFWSPKAACEKMRAFIETLNLPRRNILLIAPPVMKFGAWVQDQELIDDSVSLARLYCDLSVRIGIRFADSGQWKTTLAHDGVHMTEDDHRIFAERLAELITKEYYI